MQLVTVAAPGRGNVDSFRDTLELICNQTALTGRVGNDAT